MEESLPPENDLLNIKTASEWASNYIKKQVTTSNISYLIQYGLITKFSENSTIKVSKAELTNYYDNFTTEREVNWKEQLGNDLNWALSFDKYKESETTKHVHRLHPYKGKFIPQLVEYFLDSHTDSFKQNIYFKPGDIILDPFAGSGTTLVQACELGMHSIGVDVSDFNAQIATAKLTKYDLVDIHNEIKKITDKLKIFLQNSPVVEFEQKLLAELFEFNSKFFPTPDYRYKLKRKEIDEKSYGIEKEKEFLSIYYKLLDEHKIQLHQNKADTFLDKWYSKHIRDEIEVVLSEINKIKNSSTYNIIRIILSRTIRSCRATTHSDLATLIEPVTTTYYCTKHGKICKPLFSIIKWWESYSKDTIKRLVEFDKLRTKTWQVCLSGDSRTIDIAAELNKFQKEFANSVCNQKIKGIFSSPPYVGLIDYHQQHAYAYDLFEIERRDKLEIGSLQQGQSQEAKQNYTQAIADVLNNCKRFLANNYDVFLVANDKYNLYPTIAEIAGMQIVNQHKRPVLNRTERDKAAYSETIFHFKAI